MKDTIKEVLNNILEEFKNENVKNIAVYIRKGSMDARTKLEWEESGRTVRKESKGISVFIPKKILKTVYNKQKHSFSEPESRIVYRAEDTKGKSLGYKKIQFPDFPLINKAREWDVNVYPAFVRTYCEGFYRVTTNEIFLATPEEKTFFHELIHAAHNRLIDDFTTIPTSKLEVIAEFSAQAICRLIGKTNDTHVGNSYSYIRLHSFHLSLSAYEACKLVLSDVEMILNYILEDYDSKHQ